MKFQLTKGINMTPKLKITYCLIDNLTSFIDKKLKKTKVSRKETLSKSELLTISVIKQYLCLITERNIVQFSNFLSGF